MAQELPHLSYPLPMDSGHNSTIGENDNGKIDIETPVLIVGGGPVGMLQALILARIHKQPCTIIEKEVTTTPFPKMEYTNGRSMEIYRALGLVDELRKIGTSEVPEHYSMDEIFVSSLSPGGKLLATWPRDGAEAQRQKSRIINDGSSYLEPHMRCNQIILEKWLKAKIEAEPLIQSYWGTRFMALHEDPDSVTAEVQGATGSTLRIKSQYLIGTDGGGSRVRESVKLVSKRQYLELSVLFVHFRSAALKEFMPFPRAWHTQVLGGGVLVNQNENDMWTMHFMLHPDMDHTKLSHEDVLQLALGGCKGKVIVPFDEIFCGGLWKADVAVASKFISQGGRVLLAGDSAHQLSPIGGHGLNSGLGDAFDLGWKLSASLQGWASEQLLNVYDTERRQIADENLQHAKDGLAVLMPTMTSHLRFGPEVVDGEGPESDNARSWIATQVNNGYWLHDQNGNILGTSYKESPIIHTESGDRPKGTDARYVPTTYPGCRAPHVWLKDGTSTLDHLNYAGFSIVDFSRDGRLAEPFLQAAQELNMPVKQVRFGAADNANLRQIHERNLVLIRPDGYVAWRSAVDVTELLFLEEATVILRTAAGYSQQT